jgi:hypothetical protein
MKSRKINFLAIAAEFFLALFLATSLIRVFIADIWMPQSGLDPSWVYTMNQAVAQKLVFGKELIFTFGPYASVATHQFNPATANLQLFGGLYLVLSYFIAIWLLMKGVALNWKIIFLVALAVIRPGDAMFLVYPLIISLIVFRLTCCDGELKKINIGTSATRILVTIIFSALGLFSLIKGSFIALGAVGVAMSALMFWRNRQVSLAIICLASPVISTAAFWLISGQEISALPNYFLNLSQIISGYTEAMSVRGKAINIICFLASSLLILCFIGLQKSISRFAKAILLILFSATLFIAFKAGFVRHDAHANTAAEVQIIVALLLSFIFQFQAPFLIKWKNFKIAAVPLFAFVAWLAIDKNYSKISTQQIFDNLLNQKAAYQNLKNLALHQADLTKAFDERVAEIKKEAAFPILQGGSDIYPIDQSFLIASKNQWSPRPVFQSYSAYTEKLAKINSEHLLSERSPQNIFFKLGAIDGRLPSLDDGSSWPILLNKYEPVKMVGEFLLLKKSAAPQEISKEEFLSVEAKFAQEVEIKNNQDILFAEIEVKPTLFGRLFSIIFKPDQIWISVTTKDGSVRNQRVVSGMMKSGFVISPLVESVREFAFLYDNKGYLNHKAIKSFSISNRRGKTSSFWQENYQIKLSKIKPKYSNQILQILKLDQFEASLKAKKYAVSSKACEGLVDFVNGIIFPEKKDKIYASKFFSIKGWMAIKDSDQRIVPENIFISLVNKNGDHKLLKTHRLSRQDLKEHFKQDHMVNAGYDAFADSSNLSGEYSMTISYLDKGEIKNCPEFELLLVFSQKNNP